MIRSLLVLLEKRKAKRIKTKQKLQNFESTTSSRYLTNNN